MIEVIIADDRPAWVKKEDKWAVCFWYCPLYRHCLSRNGADCKRMGGSEIPKMKVRSWANG